MSSTLQAWRTAFLTLRDEILASPPPPTVHHLLNHLIFSQSDTLIAAAPELPPGEVSSDLILIIELVHKVCQSGAIEFEDATQLFAKLLVLVHGIIRFSTLQVNPASWAIMLDFFKKIVLSFLQKGKTGSQLIGNVPAIKATKQCLECLRSLFGLYHTVVLSDSEQLLNFVLQIVGYFEWELMPSSYLSDVHVVSGDIWEVLTVAFAMIGEVCSRVASSLPVDIWQSIIEILRKVMDFLASKNVLLEDNINALFYIELLNCLHQVLTEPRGYLADHVAGFVAALRIFFGYGLLNKAYIMNQAPNHMKQISSRSQTQPSGVLNRSKNGLYRPPHLRKNVVGNLERKVDDSPISSKPEFVSSDSDCSDNDAATTDNCSVRFSKARLAAILCIQDLCRADPKLFTAQWTMLLLSNDVLQPRKYESTLMSCLLFDPYLKVRIAAGSTIMTMLDGPASVSLKVAEFSGHSKCGSFTSLSCSLGHILMQLHSGTLYLIKHETHSRLLALSFKILMRLISSTPYSRMSAELLSTVIASVQSTIDGGFSFQNDRNSLLAAAINCLTLAFSVSPSSTHVENMLLEEISQGSPGPGGQQRSGVLYILFRYANQLSSPSMSLEVFQALKAMAHNYPNIMSLCWEQISSIAFENLRLFPDMSAGLWRGNVEQTEHTVGPIKERVMTAAVKVLDECLRAISGFKGTEDLSNDKFLDSPFTSDYVKTKAISSAPSYYLESPASTKDESQKCLLASERWLEATRRHMPLIIKHSSPMVRAASVTCFAGMTSSVFVTLPIDTQDFIISSSIDAALNDEVAAVRSAACRAIGVIACFPQMYLSSTGVLEKFIHAAERNALDSLLSVRITASWALANICDSLSHCMDALRSGRGSVESRKISEFISLLVDCSLRLARDNDKVKANAVRALGNLSRSIQFTSQPHVFGDQVECRFEIKYNGAEVSENDVKRISDAAPSACSGSYDWLEQMVQAFLSCVTTGNVKVQWNVCHALSNLFINKSLRLQEMDWASSVFSILLLLLRDSSNFKIRIQAAAALSVPETIYDYGKSYYDVVKSVEHVVENFKSDRISDPSNFKYWIALDKQLTSTMLHLLGLAASSDHRATQEFFVKKASFFEAWIKDLCLSLGDTSNSLDEVKQVVSVDQKRDVIFRTIHSLIQVYENKDHQIAQRFHILAGRVL